MKNTLRWLLDVPKGKRRSILLLMLLQAVNGGSGVLYALLLRQLVDHATDRDIAGFWRYVMLTVLLVLGQVAVRAWIRHLDERTRAVFENVFKERLLRHILHKRFAAVTAVHSGEWLNRLTSDTVVVASSYVDIVPGLVGMVVKLVAAFVMMLVLDWRFACLLVPCGAAMLVMTYLFRRILKRLHKQVQEQDGRLRIFLQEHIGSLLLIRSFATEAQTQAQARAHMDDHMAARMRKLRFSNLCNTGFGLGMNGLYLFGVCWCGYGILCGTISYGTLTAVTQLIAQIQTPVANITGYLPRFYAMTASAERLMEIERFEDDTEEPTHPIEAVKAWYAEKMCAFGLDHAGFTYYPVVDHIEDLSKDGQPTVLRDVTLEIRKGEYVAFTGHSGCGKSTVLKLLMGIYPLDSGARTLTDIEGTRPLTPAWHRLFAYVPQGLQLMSGTIREVVAFADRAAMHDDARLSRALTIACADEFVSELDAGVDTLLGERGTGLSEGQM